MMKYLKKLSCILIIVLIFTSSMVVATSASTSRCTWEVNGDTLTITGDGDLWGCNFLPSGMNVTPYEWRTVSKVVIQEGVTRIPDEAFGASVMGFGLENIKSVIIPESVTSIGSSAFYGCTGLTTISIPGSVTSIGSRAFYGCTSLTTISIPGSVTSIGSSAFYGCTGLTEVTIQEGVSSIASRAFWGCTNLKRVSLPKSFTNYINVMLSGSGSIFGECYALDEFILADGMTGLSADHIKDTAYYNDESNWENGVLYIGNNLIEAKESLAGAYSIKKGTTTIVMDAFNNCTSLTAINIPKSMTTIGVGAFYNCGHLVDVYYGGTEEDWKKMFIGANNEVFLRATMHFEPETVDSSKLFSDVPADAWYKEYTDYAVTYKILNGSGDGKLNPEKTITRAEFVQVLANLSGVDTTNKNVKTGFNDAKSGEWYAPAVKWAAENGIVDGMSPTTFAPNEKITREQMCAMLVRYIEKYLKQQLSQTGEKKAFADDAEISDWAKAYVYACQQAGLVNGVSPTKFAPQDSANRASVAALMTRFHQNYLK